MIWVTARIKWIMALSGLATFSMIYAALVPKQAVTGLFGAQLSGPGAEIVVRNWGALIALMGAMLIYGAFAAAHRNFVLIVVGTSKLIFIGLVIGFGWELVGLQLGASLVFDAVFIALFAVYLWDQPSRSNG